ncbi:autotransporter domain-containing protein [Marinicella sp. S1101]|uniref:autotransporter domain-containing protein n=1 Tax=Marinicella marina TaxID=2996016 RepID=UPI002260E9C8|nr:autotransporter domain-containing protein [Marinicella marina]MCX7553376.1 autotransporter domain-containing protein [Marinicella marina]MDJ1139108.1 autotransporter domain-containing protein [Marinicella marina]
MRKHCWLFLLLSATGLMAQEADVGVDVRLFQARVITGDLAKMEITVRNAGPDIAQGVKLRMEVAQGLFSDIATTASGPCEVNVEAGLIVCQNIGDFAAGSQKIILLRVQLEQQEQPDNLIINSEVSSNANDPNPSNNTATAVFQVQPLPTIDNYALGMLTNMPENRKKRFERAARVLGAYCSGDNLHNGLDGLCDDLLQQAELGDFETITRVLSWMRPRNVVHQARNSTKLVASQLSNIGQRMAQLRSGISGFSVADLSLSNGSQSLPVSMLGYQGDDAAAASFVSPWGFFINGNIAAGDYQYADEINDGFDFDSDSLTVGVDYRFSNRVVIGSALGYNQMKSNTGSGVAMESEGLSLNVFGLFTPTDNIYVDTRLSYARPDIKQTRNEFFELIDAIVDIEAIGRTQSEQFTAAISAGYGFNFGAWQFSPYLGIEYVDNQLDQFTESGARGFNIFYAEQDFESTKYNLGFNLSRAISTRNGVVSPQVSWQYNREDQDGGIMAMRLIGMPVDELFNVETNFTENTSSQASIGLTWVTANGKMFYLRYQQIFGLRNFDQYAISLGARFEF